MIPKEKTGDFQVRINAMTAKQCEDVLKRQAGRIVMMRDIPTDMFFYSCE